MSWKERLAALVLAGGALVAVGGCDDGADHGGADLSVHDMAFSFGTCNANPDPCCLHPDMKGCGITDGGAGD